jgi:hypothetical protein
LLQSKCSEFQEFKVEKIFGSCFVFASPKYIHPWSILQIGKNRFFLLLTFLGIEYFYLRQLEAFGFLSLECQFLDIDF